MLYKKLFYTVIFFTLFNQASIQAQWVWQNPVPTNENITKIVFKDIFNGWILTASGNLLRTTDGGESWTNANLASKPVKAIYFINNTIGWITGEGFIKTTKDGGDTWQTQNSLFSDFVGTKIFFLNENLGWIQSNHGFIKTYDGGRNWINYYSTGSLNTNDFCFIDEKTGWAVAPTPNNSSIDELLKTEDGGLSWSSQYIGSSQYSYYARLKEVKFLDSLNGYALGYYFNYKTTNGGASWSRLNSPIDFQAAAFYNKNNFIVAGKHLNLNCPVICRTPDGAYNWETNATATELQGYTFLSITLVDTGTGYAAGSNGIVYKTVNKGASWFPISKYHVDGFSSIYFYNNKLGWAWGNSVLLKTADGGTNWKKIDPGFYVSPNKIQFIDEKNGWAAETYKYSSSSKIIYTSNSGETWKTIYTGSVFDFQMINKTKGFLAGGGLYKTTDGGENWSLIEYADIHFLKVFFKDDKNGLAIGYNRNNSYLTLAKKTTDGGETWVSCQNSINGYPYNSYNCKTAIKVLINGYLLYTTFDMGDTWTISNYNFYIDQNTPVFFVDDRTGYYVNYNGVLYKTENGGIDWVMNQQLPNRGSGYSSIYFTDINNGWIAGYGATILATKNGGGIVSDDDKKENGVVNNYLLKQNYPNPFNPSTKIEYCLPTESHIKLSVYDAMGRLVKDLFNGTQQAGRHTHVFEPSGIASGIYFCKLEYPYNSQIIKMVFIK